MSDFKRGDRVAWKRRGVLRTGTVENASFYITHAYVKPDKGNRHWVSKAKLRLLSEAGSPLGAETEAE